MQCSCGGIMTYLQFPMLKNKAKAKWLGVSTQQSQVVRGPVQFIGWCCNAGCKRIEGGVYDSAGTSRITIDPATGVMTLTPCASKATTLKGAIKVTSLKAQRKINRNAGAAGQRTLDL